MKVHEWLTKPTLKNRFRGFLPVVVDVETSGVDFKTNALLEMCVTLLDINEAGEFYRAESYFEHILPFDGAVLCQESLDFNQIDPWQPLRYAVEEKEALTRLFEPIHAALKKHRCQRAVLVGHNAWFDLLFVREAAARSKVKFPFHAFTCFDTATLAGLFYGQTVLVKAVEEAGLGFNIKEAHSAIYDAEKTADLFCTMLNTWREKMAGAF